MKEVLPNFAQTNIKKVMKKLSLLVGGIILSGAVLAQKPSSDVPMTLEGQIGYNASTLAFTAPSIRFRYFLTDNIAARVTLGMTNVSRTENAYEFADNTGANGTAEFKSTAINAAIGAEYHFAGTDRLSPYVGLDIMFGGGNTSSDYENAAGPQGGVGYVADRTQTTEAKTSMFGVNLVAGADYYFAENFYIGLELGLGWMSFTTKEGSNTVTTGTNPTVTTETFTPESTDSFLGNNAIGNLRLGWRF